MSNKGFTYTLKLDAEISDLTAKTAQVKKSMQSIMDAGKAPGAEKVFASIEKALDKMREKASQPITSIAAFESFQKDANAAGTALNKLNSIIEDLGKMSAAEKMELLPPDLKQKIADANTALGTFTKAQAQAAQKSQDLLDAEKQLATAQKELTKAEGKVSDKKALISAQQQMVDKTNAEANAIKAKIDALKKYQSTTAAYDAASGNKSAKGSSKANAGKGLDGLNLPADRAAAQAAVPGLDLKNIQAVEAELTRLNEQYREASKAVTDAEATQRRYGQQLTAAQNAATVASDKITTLSSTVSRLNNEFEKNKAQDTQAAYAQLRTEAGKLGVDLSNIPVDYTEQNLIELNNSLNQLAIDGIAKVDQNVNDLQAEFAETGKSAEKFKDRIKGADGAVAELDERAKNTQAFASRIKQFIGLQGAANLARTAFRNAFEEVKRLDAVMAEMAVVTDLDIGDYWNQLPEHTKRANELGLAIEDVYKAETLYYQQGLKTNEVIAMSTETLKMARIAGLSAEDATNKMTAALRGFNMELNETSAQRVADVYSELAAITASDVDEISTAMTKTASIAASAGMEFETTSAFLSQIIETTRESAETAGTAMKTVVARFSEVKELKAQGLTSGEDSEGEIIDVNKIQTALRTVGISMDEFFQGTEGLDSIFMQLAEKWDKLDVATQRYIATTAAGSRQQSRFIAMMSDYKRTQELVVAANTSAGASQEQYEKTLDSLTSALIRLENAWNTFTMSLMNNEILKTGVDALTGLLNGINGIIKDFDKLGLGSAASIGMVIGALVLGTKTLNAFEMHLMAVDATGRRANTVLQAIGKTGKQGFTSLVKSLKSIPEKLKQIGAEAKVTGKLIRNINSKTTIAAQQAYAKALKKEQEIDQARYAAKQKINAQQAQSDALAKHYATTEELSAKATKERVSAEAALYTAMELTDDQKIQANALTAAGITADTAAILAKGGITAAMVAEYAATHGVTEAIAAEKLARELQTKGIVAQTIARIAALVGIKLENGQLELNTAKRNSNVFATIAQTIAQWAYNLALAAGCPPAVAFGIAILAIVGAAALAIVVIGLLVIGIVALAKAIQAASPEGQLKSAEEAADAAVEAAERAVEAYNNLADAFESLSDKYDTLDELTRGTKEWKEAVKEVNAEVIDLIEKYPKLAALVKPDNGVLTLDIESKEVQDILNEYEKQAAAAENASLAAKINVNEKKANYISSELVKKNEVVETMNQDTMKKMAMAMQSGDLRDLDGDGKLVTEMADWLKTHGTTADQMYADSFARALSDDIQALKEFGAELDAMAEQERVYQEQMAQNALGMVDATKYSEQQLKQMEVAASADFANFFTDKAEEQFDNMTQQEKANAKASVAKNLYGADATVSGNTITYYDEEGKKQTKELTNEEFKEQYAAIKATSDMTAAFEDLPKAINTVSSQMGKEVGAAFKKTYAAKEGQALTQSEITKLQGLTDRQLADIWIDLSDDEKMAFGGEFDKFKEHITESAELATNAFASAQEKLADMGVKIEFNAEKMNTEIAQGYANQLTYIASAAGQEGVDKVNDTIDAIAANMSQEDFSKFMGQINALDWKNMEDWERLPELLDDIGLNVPNEELENFIKVASDTAGAIRKIDLEALSEQIQKLQKLQSKIRSGEQGRNLSSEDYEALVSADSDLMSQFQQTLDGEYIYLGSSMNQLTKAIIENTEALLGQAVDQLQNKVDAAQLMEDLTNYVWEGTEIEVDITKWREQGDWVAPNYIQTVINKAIEQDIDLEQLGIPGLSRGTDPWELPPEKREEIMDGLLKIFNDLGKNSDALTTKIIDSMSFTMQSEDVTNNSITASRYRNMITWGKELSEEEQYRMKAATNTIAAQAVTAGVNKEDINQYLVAIEKMEALQKRYKNNEIDIEEFRKEYGALAKEVEVFEKTIADKTNLNKMNKSLGQTVQKIADLEEEFNNLSDESSKIEVVAKMVEDFGIEVTASNYKTIKELATNVIKGGEEGYEAFRQLMLQSATSYGLSMEQIETMTIGTWNNTTRQMSETMEAFANAMVSIGAAMWIDMADGSRRFAWATSNNLIGALKSSGITSEFEAWENPYNELYNLNQKLNVEIRKREQLERRYERALNDSAATAKELADITGKQLQQLQKEAIIQKDIAQQALAQAKSMQEAYSEFDGLYSFDAETGMVQVDWEKVGSLGWSADQGSAFEKFISYLEEQGDTFREAQDSIEDIKDDVAEIQQRGRDAVSTIYDQVKEGLVKQYEDQLDALETVNESIQEAANTLVSKMQEQIDEARQARDNKKTENSLADKRLRLAYLQRNTSGGNAMEIAQLQKELTEEEQSYTDSLVDQAIEKLQDTNEKAAEQREQQLELQRAQLDAYVNSGKIWNDVKGLVDAGFKQVANGVPFADTEAGKLAKINEGIEQLNPISAEDFYTELDRNAKEGAIHQGFLSITGEEGKNTTLQNATTSILEKLDVVADAASKVPNITVPVPSVYVTVSGGGSLDGETELTSREKINAIKEVVNTIDGWWGTSYANSGEKSLIDWYFSNHSEQQRKDGFLLTEELFYDVYDPSMYGFNGMENFTYEDYVKVMKLMHEKFKGFNTGGLADFTGPAWLDGTKSKPEIVLNQTDSANFMILRDILADILDGTSGISQSGSNSGKNGDNYYDIEINVDNISDDYDVEQLANKIKSMIYEDSIYRNVNMVSGIR